MSGLLYIVATPIGNLEDITFRAINTFKNVDLILCEDTRVTRNLLNRYEISTPVSSYHQHTPPSKIKEIEEILRNGKNIALVTDAGTPGISDPGNMLIQQVLKSIKELAVIAIPGPSAAIAALSVSGFPSDKFIFMGFPPQKNKRTKFFKEIEEFKYTIVFYESSHRIKKCLLDLKENLNPRKQIVVCRELTKKFESIYRGTIEEILTMNIPDRGEFVIIINQ